jgi:hypothetical protein
VKILLSAQWYPIAIARYFELAFRARSDVQLITFGPTSGKSIPWGPEFNYPEHAFVPDIHTPVAPAAPMEWWFNSLAMDVDLVVQIDSTYFMDPPPNIPNVIIATDPHCINYDRQRVIADYFFNMQESYKREGDYILPYAYCAYTHYPEPDIEPSYDVVINGLQYKQRRIVAEILREKGRSVYSKLGDIWDDYRVATAKAQCVFTHSSQDDLIARVFESLAMKKPLVCNMVSALPRHFTDTVHLITFQSNDIYSAVRRVEDVLDHPDKAREMAERGYEKVKGETYDARVEEVLEVVGA